MKKLTAIFEGLDKVLSAISAITLFIMMLWIFVDVTLRSLFNNPIPGTIEITGEYLMVILVYLMLSNTHKVEGHVSVDSFQKKMSARAKDIAKFITNLLTAVFFLMISIFNFQKGLEYLDKNIQSVGVLEYPLAPALFIISIGLAMITLRVLIECISILFPKKITIDITVTEAEENIKLGI
jgi:TRAP-type transport system small permease protein